MLIVGRASATYSQVRDYLARRDADQGRAPYTFRVEMLPWLWAAAERYVLDPVGVVAQSAHETGWGAFDGVITTEWRNTCGLKVRKLGIHPEADGDRPLAHAMFPSWEVGAVAHTQHLRAYAGVRVTDGDWIVDPRYGLVSGAPAIHYADLSGRWSPRAEYGANVEAVAEKILGGIR